MLIQNTWSANCLPETIGLRIHDFVPDDEFEAANIPDGDISIDGNGICGSRTSMKNTAC
ncbi:hypothetical protein V1506DRAFT_546582 [Lipomyces tetrasporus]